MPAYLAVGLVGQPSGSDRGTRLDLARSAADPLAATRGRDWMRKALKIAFVSSVVFAGCASESEAPTQTASDAVTGDNGISLNGISLNGISVNGISLNGISLNGISLNGISLNGISVNGISLNGISVNGISLNGISLNGISLNGISLNGTDFVGAQLAGALSNGDSLGLRIDAIAPLTGANADVLAYSVSAATDAGWTSLCGYESDGSARQALIVPGTWDVHTGAWSDAGAQFSFACRHASIAKCVEFGYKSWLGYEDHHHACVRMLRADYCGDGTPHTVNGTQINVYDDAGVQADAETWPVDAEWTADGARCVNHTRGGSQPSCYDAKYDPTCGTFDNGALLIDEYNGQ
jgi:FlaG/FlaF family flagellin (archaellin)